MATITVETVDFVSIATRDISKAAKFYEEMLGLEPSNRDFDRGFAEFEIDNLTVSLFMPEKMGFDFSPNLNHIALRVDDVADARKKLEDAGIEFDGDVLDTGVCHMAFFSDPDGNAIMLHRRYAPR